MIRWVKPKRSRSQRTVVAVLVAIAAVVIVPTFEGGAAYAEPPSWSSGTSRWSGSGTAFIPGGSFVGPPNAQNDPCPGCSWSVHPMCEVGDQVCHDRYGCGPDSEFVLIFFGRSGQTPELLGGECISGAPVSAEVLSSAVTDRVRQSAPTAQIRFQPSSSALTSVPTIFRTGQEQSLRRSDSISGIPVDFHAVARWRWSWGDGSAGLRTSSPGGRWPDTSVAHTYRKPGTYRAVLTTVWTATFTVNGRGPLPVSGGPIVQQTATRVPVVEARALLVEL